MISDWMNAAMVVAIAVITFVGGLKIGRLQEQDAQRARVAKRLVSVHALLRTTGPVPVQRHPEDDGCHPDYHELGIHAPKEGS
jgi:hypothetical protein